MTRLIRNFVLLAAFVIAWVLALLQVFRRDAALEPGSGSYPKGQPAPAPRNVKRWAFRTVAFLTVAALGGFLFATSGIISIKASSGHWAITAWLLNFAMRRSVITHSLTIKTPSLNDHALVLKGAGHYETGCRPCHGSPDLPQQPRIANWMTPQPPNLSREVPRWDDNELFYIVKHGVKFTGMPGWPAQTRDDEVWAMVAFLRRLPNLSTDEYKRLARGSLHQANDNAPIDDLTGPRRVPASVMESCGRCHGVDGSGRGVGAFPKLAGQKPEYFVASMEAYALGRRSSGIMEPIAVGLSREATAELAGYYANLKSSPPSYAIPPANTRNSPSEQRFAVSSREETKTAKQLSPQSRRESLPVDALMRSPSEPKSRPAVSVAQASKIETPQSLSAIERGREIALHGIPHQRVPACSECHGPGEIRRNPHYPILAGQYADYLLLQLTLFQKQARGGTPYAHLMQPVVAGLKTEQMRDVALFYESLQK